MAGMFPTMVSDPNDRNRRFTGEVGPAWPKPLKIGYYLCLIAAVLMFVIAFLTLANGVPDRLQPVRHPVGQGQKRDDEHQHRRDQAQVVADFQRLRPRRADLTGEAPVPVIRVRHHGREHPCHRLALLLLRCSRRNSTTTGLVLRRLGPRHGILVN